MDKLTPQQRKKNMQANKSKGTKIEVIFGKALWASGCRYRKNVPDIFGRPDFCIKKYKIAIFIDGEFWHGKDWEIKKFDHKSNIDFWTRKIERNIERDKEVNNYLLNHGWTVLRFWGEEVKKSTNKCIQIVLKAISDAKYKKTKQ